MSLLLWNDKNFIDNLSVCIMVGNILSWPISGGIKDNGVMETCNFILTVAICKAVLFPSSERSP